MPVFVLVGLQLLIHADEFLCLFILLVSFVSILSHATSPSTEIRGKLRLPDEAKVKLNTTRITLNDGEFFTYTQSDGSFVFYDVGPGVHVLDVHSTNYMFPHVKIQLLETAMNNPKCIEYAFPGAAKQAIPHPIVLTALAKYEYFERRQGFNVFMLLKNPMVLMMLVSAALMFIMPKMMEGLDPEQQAHFRKQMENQGDPAKLLSSMFQEIASSGTEEDEGKKGSGLALGENSASKQTSKGRRGKRG